MVVLGVVEATAHWMAPPERMALPAASKFLSAQVIEQPPPHVAAVRRRSPKNPALLLLTFPRPAVSLFGCLDFAPSFSSLRPGVYRDEEVLA